MQIRNEDKELAILIFSCTSNEVRKAFLENPRSMFTDVALDLVVFCESKRVKFSYNAVDVKHFFYKILQCKYVETSGDLSEVTYYDADGTILCTLDERKKN